MSLFTSQSMSFRQAEISRLLDYARSGESASVVGVSGVGKSNLFHHLLDAQTQRYYLKDEVGRYLFVRVNFHYLPTFDIRSVYSLILEQLELLEEEADRFGLKPKQIEQIGAYHEKLLDAGTDMLKVRRYFNLALRVLLRSSERRLIFLFDQFDLLYQEANPRLFANLRGLREAYKYRISYFVFTRHRLSVLAEMDLAREEFHELLAPNEMGLPPYVTTDALDLLRRVAHRYRFPLDDALAVCLVTLTGGHAGLLRAAYLAVMQERLSLPANTAQAIALLLEIPNVEAEGRKLWESLTLAERRWLTRYIGHGIAGEEVQTEYSLRMKGLLKNKPLFSPLFADYVRKQEALGEQALSFDKATRTIWVLGQATKPLTSTEFNVFCLLYDSVDTVITRDELMVGCWGSLEGVSDDAVNATISRLRQKIEPDPSNPRFIKTIRGQGYKLNVQ